MFPGIFIKQGHVWGGLKNLLVTPGMFGEIALGDSSPRALAIAGRLLGSDVPTHHIDLRALPWRERWGVAFLFDDLEHHARRYTRGDFARLADDRGFELIDARYFIFFLSPLLVASRWFGPNARRMSRDEMAGLSRSPSKA